MSLTFPLDTSKPYIDVDSGLKYVWNDAVGAWEAALQPPVIVSPNPPELDLPGFLWWNSLDGNLFVNYQDSDSIQWVQTQASGGEMRLTYSASAPADAYEGAIWIGSEDPERPTLNVLTSSGWINIDRELVQSPYNGPRIKTSSSHPNDAREADLYYNTFDKSLYVYHLSGWRKIEKAEEGIQEIRAGEGVFVHGDKIPTITLRQASSTQTGVIRLATAAEAAHTGHSNVALSPQTLKANIRSYIPEASITTSGMIKIASPLEIKDSTNSTTAVTPAQLHAHSTAIPVGATLGYHSNVVPDGFLLCDGSEVSRTTYSKLFAVIGVSFGLGDELTTFNIPSLQRQIIKF